MKVCCCTLAGTKACRECPNNPTVPYDYSYPSRAITTNGFKDRMLEKSDEEKDKDMLESLKKEREILDIRIKHLEDKIQDYGEKE